MLSVRHLKTRASFQYGLILMQPQLSSRLPNEQAMPLTYPSTTLKDGMMLARISIVVKTIDRKMAASKIPKRGDLFIKMTTDLL